MKSLLVPAAIVASLLAFNAQAKLPLINATCPGNLEVHVDQGGPVYVNGKEATLKVFNENAYEARDAATATTISITINPDGSPDVSYTGKNRAHGVCSLAGADAAGSDDARAAAATPRETYPASEQACLAAVAKKVGVASSKLSVIDALGGEAGISVSVTVPGADAPWACMTDQKGKVWNVSYTGSEGKL
ncbi:hypothetical protein MNR01_12400 [Lysobacter sp. S4-A87]|uniref:hypothetical protein n=1 Tax=Lysobacter sp. S4-A87 TaxID=2925843 RepID=UPI001F53CFBF|nr:hypothetical protein [Lysobacter sp. S4-A87]UNK48546.1 hypothetical protein MNR01_12400 [Lysobacter sp. S4-A87]